MRSVRRTRSVIIFFFFFVSQPYSSGLLFAEKWTDLVVFFFFSFCFSRPSSADSEKSLNRIGVSHCTMGARRTGSGGDQGGGKIMSERERDSVNTGREKVRGRNDKRPYRCV